VRRAEKSKNSNRRKKKVMGTGHISEQREFAMRANLRGLCWRNLRREKVKANGGTRVREHIFAEKKNGHGGGGRRELMGTA